MSVSLLSAYQQPTRITVQKAELRQSPIEAKSAAPTQKQSETAELELSQPARDRLEKLSNRRSQLMARLEKFSGRFERLENSEPENDRKRLRMMERTTKALERSFNGIQRTQLRVDAVLSRIDGDQQSLLPSGKDGSFYDPTHLTKDATDATTMRDLSDDLTSTWKKLRNSFGKKDMESTGYGQRFEALGEKLASLSASTDTYRKNVISAVPPGSRLSVNA